MSGFDPDSYIQANTPAGFDPDSYISQNSAKPGFMERAVKGTIDALPAIGATTGAILATPGDAVAPGLANMAGAYAGGYLGTATKNLINRYYDPESAPKTATEAITSPMVGGANQASIQGAGDFVAPYVAKAVQSAAGPAASALKSFAAKKAVAATGATGVQASKFATGTGQELIDQGLVKFGDSQAGVAKRISGALDQTGEKIGSVLQDLDKKGVTVAHSDIVDALRKRADSLGKDPSQFGVSDSLSKLADRIETMAEQSGSKTIPLSEAETTKRGFQAAANYNSAPLDLSVSKEAASVYRQAVEDAATKFDPKAGEAFAAAKKTYGVLNPVQEAAAKRASTLAQSPHGGLMDTVATIAGEGIGGIPGAIAAPIARRAVVTRIAPSLAASANSAGNALGRAAGAAESVVGAAAPAAIRASAGAPAAVEPTALKVAGQPPGQPNRSPAKGPDAWAQRGLQSLGIQDQALSQRLLSDPKAKQLLIQASSFPPGHKALKNIMSQIQKGWGNP